MGCFSYLCNNSGKAALSTSFNGSPCYLFLLKNGKVIEEMYGNYNSYAGVFKKDLKGSYKWSMDWGDVCDLNFNSNDEDGIAMILAEHYGGIAPTSQSESDPNQGWGSYEEGEDDLMGDTSSDGFPIVSEPYHKVY